MHHLLSIMMTDRDTMHEMSHVNGSKWHGNGWRRFLPVIFNVNIFVALNFFYYFNAIVWVAFFYRHFLTCTFFQVCFFPIEKPTEIWLKKTPNLHCATFWKKNKKTHQTPKKANFFLKKSIVCNAFHICLLIYRFKMAAKTIQKTVS